MADRVGQPLLTVERLAKAFIIRRGFLRREVARIDAVKHVSFEVRRGESLGLVGESGSGKTTTARCIVRAVEPTAGRVWLQVNGQAEEITALDYTRLREVRRHVQMVFQDPYSSLNPRMTVQEIVSEHLVCYKVGSRTEQRERVEQLLELVGLDRHMASRYPHAFSGGQRQRIGIARALSLNPDLIIADEPVSALDVSIQSQILNLLMRLQEQLGLTYLFIAHDLAVVQHVCDRVAVMYAGRIVELATTQSIFLAPLHPYTELLLSAVPRPDPSYELPDLSRAGEAQSADVVAGCPFAPRCSYATDTCRDDEPELRALTAADGSVRRVACHYAEELSLAGVAS